MIAALVLTESFTTTRLRDCYDLTITSTDCVIAMPYCCLCIAATEKGAVKILYWPDGKETNSCRKGPRKV